ncbi:MAG TPA: helix-turn-helix transcriptional regulator [Candidatus Acidoferrum sp.]|nr:helix-turn-helix transcriptional regulator [Candidatus Acidoferrum sp.]
MSLGLQQGFLPTRASFGYEVDAKRRHDLRNFLMQFRARLRPDEVGLPHTRRRRVAGLRRDEVAELAGVSSDWYRRLESGRDIRVSPQIVARLARVLRMTPHEELALFALAVPEVYQAQLALRGFIAKYHAYALDDATLRLA